MEYQVSARKYRPMTFASVVGQEALTTTLKNAVTSGKLAHAFLFCGPRGVGKTTCARIFARTINCSSPTADGEACGECESCRAFTEQRSYNIFELDAASNNSVENIKQLMEQTRIPPQVGRYKVFIIDEVHMLSTAAFNAFLKTLEEPPTYVIFILATTEKNKLLPTILSRCQIYDFDRMTVTNTVNHLRMVAESEGYTYEDEALQIIAEKADGGMRDALSIFDQAASFCQGHITKEKVIKDLNLMDIDNYFQLVDLCYGNKVMDVMILVNKMLSDGMDGNNIVNGLAEHLRNVMMARDEKTIFLLQTSQRYAEKYKEQASKCSASFLFKALQILNRCDLNYRQSSNKQLLVELSMIEVAQITQPDDAADGGPRKGRRLKSLFKFIVPQQQPEVKKSIKVAATPSESVKKTETKQESKPAEQAPKEKIAPVKNIANIKIGKFGGSFSDILSNKNEVQEEVVTEEPTEEIVSTFDESKLLFEWQSMCSRMSSVRQLIGLASSMKNLQPVITDYPNIEVSVSNSILLDQLKEIQKRIRATLVNSLHNSNITINFKLAEGAQIKRMLTKGEMFAKLLEENGDFKDFVKTMELELV